MVTIEHRRNLPKNFMKNYQILKNYFTGTTSSSDSYQKSVSKSSTNPLVPLTNYNYFRKVLESINNNKYRLLNNPSFSTNPAMKKTNLKNNTSVKTIFENDLKSEIGKLEGKMKIGKSTLKRLAEKIRSRRYSDSQELKNMKFSKPYLQRFTAEQHVNYTKKSSNQIKKTPEELEELRKPINDLLAEKGFTKDRVINLDESGFMLTESHQKGSYTIESDPQKNFKELLEKLLVFFSEIVKSLIFHIFASNEC